MRTNQSLAPLFVFLAAIALFPLTSTGQGSTAKKGESGAARGIPTSETTGNLSQSVIPVQPTGPIRLETDKPPSPSIWPTILGPVVSGLLTLIGVWIGLDISQRNTAKTIDAALASNQATLRQKMNENELHSIQ